MRRGLIGEHLGHSYSPVSYTHLASHSPDQEQQAITQAVSNPGQIGFQRVVAQDQK